MPLLEVTGLSCTVRTGGFLGVGGIRKRVLTDITFSVPEGSIVGLMGESGSGKSTLARCLCGLQTPDSGSIVFDRLNIFPETDNRNLCGLSIQMLFQGGGVSLDPRMTIHDSLAEAFHAGGIRVATAERRDLMVKVLSSVGLAEGVLRKRPHQLSGGEQQRAALARTLVVSPRLVVLDEPTSSLDVLTRSGILFLIRQLNEDKGITILCITHDRSVAENLCDSLIHLREGRMSPPGARAL